MYAFGQVDPRTSGEVSAMEVPISRYFGSAASQGYHDSVLDTVMRMHELNVADHDDSRMLSPEEANNQYGEEGLSWDEPVRESVAKIVKQRHQEERDRHFALSQSDHSVITGITGMGVQMASSLLNPVDLGLMMIPFVGEADKLAEAGSILGRGALSRGIVTRQALKTVTPFPTLAEHMISGMGYESLAQVPKQIAAQQEHTDPGDPLTNIFNTGAMAGVFHIGTSLALSAIKRMSPMAREAAAKRALDQFIKGDPIDVSREVTLGAVGVTDTTHVETPEVGSTAPEKPVVPDTIFTNEMVQGAADVGVKTRKDVQRFLEQNYPGLKINNETAAKLRDMALKRQTQTLVDEARSDEPTPREVDNKKAVHEGKVLTEEQIADHQHNTHEPTDAEISKLDWSKDEDMEAATKAADEAEKLKGKKEQVDPNSPEYIAKSFEDLKAGKPADSIMRPLKHAYDAGYIKSPEDLKKWVDRVNSVVNDIKEGKPVKEAIASAKEEVPTIDWSKDEDMQKALAEAGPIPKGKSRKYDHIFDALKSGIKPGDLHALGIIPKVWDDLVEVVRAAYHGGSRATEAITKGVEWLKKNHKEVDPIDARKTLFAEFVNQKMHIDYSAIHALGVNPKIWDDLLDVAKNAYFKDDGGLSGAQKTAEQWLKDNHSDIDYKAVNALFDHMIVKQLYISLYPLVDYGPDKVNPVPNIKLDRVLYRGTTQQHLAHLKSDLYRGIFLTPNIENSIVYGHIVGSYVVDPSTNFLKLTETNKEAQKIVTEFANKFAGTGVELADEGAQIMRKVYDKGNILDEIKRDGKFTDFETVSYFTEMSREFEEFLQEKGYDGVHFLHADRPTEHEVYIFDSKRVKKIKEADLSGYKFDEDMEAENRPEVMKAFNKEIKNQERLAKEAIKSAAGCIAKKLV